MDIIKSLVIMSSQPNIARLLKEAQEYDPDMRYMAANDLCNEWLKENSSIESTVEKQILTIFLKQLDDQSVDVQGNAVRCIKKIVGKIQESQLGEVIDKLMDLILNGKSEFRDIYATCLKGIIGEAPDAASMIFSNVLLPKALQGVEMRGSEAQEESLDILGDLLRRFGATLHVQDPSRLIRPAMSVITDARMSLRKKSTQCIGAISIILPQKQLYTLVEDLISRIQKATAKKDKFTYIQAINSISRNVGYKLASHLPKIIPMFFPFCNVRNLDITSSEVDMDHDIIELCLTTFENFLKRCPRDIVNFIPDIFQLAMGLISYDPNYSYGEEVMEEEGWGSDDDDAFSDVAQDDSSWKVRRSAVHVLEAVIKSRPETLSSMYVNLVDKLVERFVEREENVKLSIFSTFSALIKSIIVGESSSSSSQDDMAPPSLVRMRSSAMVLHDQVPGIIDGVLKELGSKSMKTRQGITTFLLDMSLSLPDKLVEQLPRLLPEILKNLADKANVNIRFETLVMIKRLLRSTARPEIIEESGTHLLPHIQEAIRDDYFKITAEGLRLAASFSRALPRNPNYVTSLFPLVFDRLNRVDIDQEVKLAAINSATAIIIASSPALRPADISRAIDILSERIKNEGTRLVCLKSFLRIASTPTQVEISAATLTSLIAELVSQLHRQSRALKLTTLETLVAILKKYNLPAPKHLELIDELKTFVKDDDLHLAQHALDSIGLIVKKERSVTRNSLLATVDMMRQLARSTVLQGATLSKLCEAYSVIAKANISNLDVQFLTNHLAEEMDSLHRSSLTGLAKCCASVALAATPQFRDSYLQRCVEKLNAGTVASQHSALCIGEIGRHIDLSGRQNITQGLIRLFDHPNEDTKISAATSLGSLAIGNLTAFLPVIFQNFSVQTHRYLLLISLKEVITQHSEQMGAYIQTTLPLLLEYCENTEESVRMLVSECFGKLFVACPHEIGGSLVEKLVRGSALAKATVASSIKVAASAKEGAADAIQITLEPLIALLRDGDLNVKKAAFTSLNSVSHNLPNLIKHYVPDVLERALVESKVNPALIRVVDLGPFTHKVDDGIPLRKAAYSLMETFQELIPEKVEPNQLAAALVTGLDDPSDEVQMICHQILCKLSSWSGGAVLGALDALVDPLTRTVEKQVKSLSAKQEVERSTDVLRSVLRAIEMVNCILDSDTNTKFQEFYASIQRNPEVDPVLKAIKGQRDNVL